MRRDVASCTFRSATTSEVTCASMAVMRLKLGDNSGLAVSIALTSEPYLSVDKVLPHRQIGFRSSRSVHVDATTCPQLRRYK